MLTDHYTGAPMHRPAPLVLDVSVTSGKNCSRKPGCRGHRYASQASYNTTPSQRHKGVKAEAPMTLEEDV